MRNSHGTRAGGVIVTALALLLTLPAGAADGVSAGAPPGDDRRADGWIWPVWPPRVERAFEAPAHRYGPGHRGIDLRAEPDATVVAPAAGEVAFSGSVAGRGILTIDHGSGLVSTLEPVDSDLPAGTAVTAGQTVAELSVGGHAEPGTLHFGVRRDGEYINPLLLLGSVPRAVLLPCC